MFDQILRSRSERLLGRVAHAMARRGISAVFVTVVGFSLGVGACVAMSLELRAVALTLFVLNRLADGLDGMIARIEGSTDQGGFVDIVADFAIYAGFIAAVAVAVPPARLAAVAVLVAYYLSGTAFLAWSSLAERRSAARPDNRSLHFPNGLAEGAETVAAYVLLCVWPGATEAILWTFAAMVGITALQRVVFAWQFLGAVGLSAHDE